MVAAGHLLLGDAAFAAQHAPDFVLQLGATPTSKAYRLWLERRPPDELVLVDAHGAWSDPGHLGPPSVTVSRPGRDWRRPAEMDPLARPAVAGQRGPKQGWLEVSLGASRLPTPETQNRRPGGVAARPRA